MCIYHYYIFLLLFLVLYQQKKIMRIQFNRFSGCLFHSSHYKYIFCFRSLVLMEIIFQLEKSFFFEISLSFRLKKYFLRFFRIDMILFSRVELQWFCLSSDFDEIWDLSFGADFHWGEMMEMKSTWRHLLMEILNYGIKSDWEARILLVYDTWF